MKYRIETQLQESDRQASNKRLSIFIIMIAITLILFILPFVINISTKVFIVLWLIQAISAYSVLIVGWPFLD